MSPYFAESEPEPEPTPVDWPALVARCERRRVPVLRVDQRTGDMHLIRTTAQLRTEWED